MLAESALTQAQTFTSHAITANHSGETKFSPPNEVFAVFKTILADTELVSVKAAAEIAGVSTSAVSRWIINGARLRDGVDSSFELSACPPDSGPARDGSWNSLMH